MMHAGIGILIAAVAAVAPAQDVASLGWLSGTWVSETPSGWTEEHWSDARGGTIVGVSRSGSADEVTFFEYMRIEAGEQGPQFVAQPKGAPPSAFPLVDASGSRAVFENPAHDYPTRIEYRRDGDRLTATISGPEGANPQSWSFCPRGVAC